MTVRRLAPLALIAVASAGGCAASRMGQVPPRAIASPSPAAPAISEMVYRHNRNAELVTSVEAVPSVSVASRLRGGGSTTGKMVFERPHNFRFVVSRASFGNGQLADIGSNNDEFWFWSSLDKANSDVYVASYDAPASGNGSYELPFQPEWIVEALGLREIPPEEERGIRTTATTTPGTVAWTHTRTSLRGEATRKVTIVNEATGDVVEHRFYAPGGTKPIAIARPTGTKEVATDGEPGRKVRMPQKIHLELAALEPKQSPVVMDLVLSDLKVNAAISQARRDELFAVPTIAGSAVVRLDEVPAPPRGARVGSNRGETERRQSLPAPPAGRMELQAPAPFDVDDAHLKRSDAMPLSPDLPPSGDAEGLDGVVGTGIPTGPRAPVVRPRREVAP